VKEEKGLGLKAMDSEGNTYQIGSKNILMNLEEEGYDVYVKKNSQLIAKIAIEDTIKPEAKELMDTLRKLKITPILLSGDRQEKCDALAKKLGIDQVYAEKLPHEKLDIINTLRQSGTTAMVGDGINDAPALTTADVGIS